jgi:hypothetical protein
MQKKEDGLFEEILTSTWIRKCSNKDCRSEFIRIDGCNEMTCSTIRLFEITVTFDTRLFGAVIPFGIKDRRD